MKLQYWFLLILFVISILLMLLGIYFEMLYSIYHRTEFQFSGQLLMYGGLGIFAFIAAVAFLHIGEWRWWRTEDKGNRDGTNIAST